MSIYNNQMTKRKMDSLKTREKIFKSAMNLFTRYGFQNVSIDDITRIAGVSRGSFYTYFKSKALVLEEHFLAVDKEYERAIVALPHDCSAYLQLRTILEVMLEFLEDVYGRPFTQTLFAEQINPNQTVNSFNQKDRPLYRLINNAVETGIQNGEFKQGFTFEEISTFYSQITRSIIYEWCLTTESVQLKVEGMKYFDLVMSCILK